MILIFVEISFPRHHFDGLMQDQQKRCNSIANTLWGYISIALSHQFILDHGVKNKNMIFTGHPPVAAVSGRGGRHLGSGLHAVATDVRGWGWWLLSAAWLRYCRQTGEFVLYFMLPPQKKKIKWKKERGKKKYLGNLHGEGPEPPAKISTICIILERFHDFLPQMILKHRCQKTARHLVALWGKWRASPRIRRWTFPLTITWLQRVLGIHLVPLTPGKHVEKGK